MGSRKDHSGPDHKLKALCREVERTLTVALGACDDEQVCELMVIAVEPAPDGSRLMVTVYPSILRDDFDIAEVQRRLDEQRGFLRQEIAAALQRKRTPELAFRVVPPGGLDTNPV